MAPFTPNSYKPSKDLWEATLLRRIISVQRLARSFVTYKKQTDILLLLDKYCLSFYCLISYFLVVLRKPSPKLIYSKLSNFPYSTRLSYIISPSPSFRRFKLGFLRKKFNIASNRSIFKKASWIANIKMPI